MHTNKCLSPKYLCHRKELEEREVALKSYSVHSPSQSSVPPTVSLTTVQPATTYILSMMLFTYCPSLKSPVPLFHSSK